jgi:hypothetical protein
MSKESDADLMARIPHAGWNTPIPITSLETREVRYACPLCVGLNPLPAGETHATDEAVILKHIEEVHGLKSEASVYLTPEEACQSRAHHSAASRETAPTARAVVICHASYAD